MKVYLLVNYGITMHPFAIFESSGDAMKFANRYSCDDEPDVVSQAIYECEVGGAMIQEVFVRDRADEDHVENWSPPTGPQMIS